MYVFLLPRTTRAPPQPLAPTIQSAARKPTFACVSFSPHLDKSLNCHDDGSYGDDNTRQSQSHTPLSTHALKPPHVDVINGWPLIVILFHCISLCMILDTLWLSVLPAAALYNILFFSVSFYADIISNFTSSLRSVLHWATDRCDTAIGICCSWQLLAVWCHVTILIQSYPATLAAYFHKSLHFTLNIHCSFSTFLAKKKLDGMWSKFEIFYWWWMKPMGSCVIVRNFDWNLHILWVLLFSEPTKWIIFTLITIHSI